MRLRPPIYWIVRNSVEDDKIDGYTIPSGKIVVVMSYLIHCHPDVWEQPDVFDPDRFCPENVNGRHQLAWLPFGSGQRQCIGRDFAIMEGQLILASLLQRFKVIPEAAHTVKPYVSTSLRTNGVMVTLEHRG
ncbi:MAG: cytochrome P450 [Chloroflexi bacterium]|nr:cytochrome P450 [Chloroflexota bacterium]